MKCWTICDALSETVPQVGKFFLWDSHTIVLRTLFWTFWWKEFVNPTIFRFRRAIWSWELPKTYFWENELWKFEPLKNRCKIRITRHSNCGIGGLPVKLGSVGESTHSKVGVYVFRFGSWSLFRLRLGHYWNAETLPKSIFESIKIKSYKHMTLPSNFIPITLKKKISISIDKYRYLLLFIDTHYFLAYR